MRKQRSAKSDFTAQMLPHNRVEVFFDVIKQRYDVLFKIGLLSLAFLLPAIVVGLIGELSYVNAAGEGATGEELFDLQLFFAIVNAGPFALVGFGLAGIMRIIRNLVWGEPIIFGKDFSTGVKQNGAVFVFTFLLFALINVVVTAAANVLPSGLVKALPVAVCVAVFLPVGEYVLCSSVVYKDGFFTLVKNSAKFYIKSAPISLLFAFLLSAALCVCFIGPLALRLSLTAFAVVFLLPLYLLARTLYSHGVFDKLVNAALYPEYVDRGVYRINE